MTDRYAVIGHPIAHSRSPWIHARFAALTGQALVYEHCLAPLDGFADTVRGLVARGWRGANVTVPFKPEARALSDTVSDRARLAGAVNVLTFEGGRIHGDNSDGVGLVRDIEQHAGVRLAGQRVLLLGAGGGAAGVLGPLLAAGPAQLVVSNRTPARAQALVAQHQPLAKLQKVELKSDYLWGLRSGYDVVINATAASLAGAGILLAPEVLNPGCLVVDLMYGPSAAPFLAWAAQHGAVPRDGLGMLVEQAAEAFALWRGVRPPTAPVLDELRTLVDAPPDAPLVAHG